MQQRAFLVRCLSCAILSALPCPLAYGQFEKGEVRVAVTDTAGLALPSTVSLVSDATRTHRANQTNDAGEIAFRHLQFAVEDLAANLWSNTLFDAIIAFQQCGFVAVSSTQACPPRMAITI